MRPRLLLILLLAGGCDSPPDPPVQEVTVRLQDGSCVAEFQGRRVRLPAESAALEERLKAAKAARTQVTLASSGEAPYRCVGPVVLMLQRQAASSQGQVTGAVNQTGPP